MIDFPNAPTLGQQFTAAGVTWTWDGVKWTPVGLPNTTVQAMNDNRIINGDMRVDQRGVASGGGGTAIDYTVDRWGFNSSLTTKGTWTRNPNSPGFAFPYSLRFLSNSAYVPAAGDYFGFYQVIEADMVSDFQWGSSSAQSVTLSFWVYSSLTGTFGGSVQNVPTTRSYPFAYSISTANVWTKIAVTIPGDTAGTWVLAGNAASIMLSFDFGGGATYRGPANTWASANYVGATGSVNVVSTNNATFYLTGVKLEIGSIATPFNHQSLAKSLADCQRYYQRANCALYGYGAAGGSLSYRENFAVVMCATPTIAFQNTTITNGSSLNSTETTASGFLPYVTATATGYTTFDSTYTADAEF